MMNAIFFINCISYYFNISINNGRELYPTGKRNVHEKTALKRTGGGLATRARSTEGFHRQGTLAKSHRPCMALEGMCSGIQKHSGVWHRWMSFQIKPTFPDKNRTEGWPAAHACHWLGGQQYHEREDFLRFPHRTTPSQSATGITIFDFQHRDTEKLWEQDGISQKNDILSMPSSQQPTQGPNGGKGGLPSPLPRHLHMGAAERPKEDGEQNTTVPLDRRRNV